MSDRLAGGIGLSLQGQRSPPARRRPDAGSEPSGARPGGPDAHSRRKRAAAILAPVLSQRPVPRRSRIVANGLPASRSLLDETARAARPAIHLPRLPTDDVVPDVRRD